jgi:beta-lactamase regulating signal transducer with metallopeptidase domain
MTGYEMVYLFNEYVGSAMQTLMHMTTLMFAFLVVGYYVGAKLTQTMTSIVVGLYAIIASLFAYSVSSVMTDAFSLGRTIKAMALQEGSVIAWHGFSRAPDLAFSVAPMIVTLVVLVAVVASIFFFFHARGQDLAAD